MPDVHCNTASLLPLKVHYGQQLREDAPQAEGPSGHRAAKHQASDLNIIRGRDRNWEDFSRLTPQQL